MGEQIERDYILPESLEAFTAILGLLWPTR
jgi:hypothetical protein